MTDELMAVEEPDEIDLFHYASKYYDPVKAKAYYERTKKLKGRKAKATESLTTEQRAKISQGKTLVRKEITKAKTASQKKLMKNQAARLEKLRKDAVKTRDEIVKKLQDRVEELTKGIEDEVPPPKLNEIPPNASPAQRAYLEKQNARLTAIYKSKRSKAAKKASEDVKAAREAAQGEVKKVATGLKSAVEKARKDYKTKTENVKVKYKKALATEIKNIEAKVR